MEGTATDRIFIDAQCYGGRPNHPSAQLNGVLDTYPGSQHKMHLRTQKVPLAAV